MGVVLAIDAGTTGVRTLALDETGAVRAMAYREFPQYFPRPGWVEHDADEIASVLDATLRDVVAAVDSPIATIGITNQRETVVAWDRRSGRPVHRAIVWQDRRTAGRCDELAAQGRLPLVRRRTGLVLDPYFSGTKMAWLLADGGVAAGPDLALATVDTWVLWQLTAGAVYATDPSNASRTMLYDIVDREWSAELAGLAEGVWPDLDTLAAQWQLDASFEPAADRTAADAAYAQWQRAVDRSRHWAPA